MFNDTIIYIVSGLGCYGSDPASTAEYLKYISEVSNVPIENIKYKCHKSSSAIKCILKTYFKSMPLKESRFVYNLADEITADILEERNNHVFVFGFSFGGAITNRVAEILNTNYKNYPDNYNKLSMVGFGSIYIPSYESIENINIINYLSNSDVAMKCNKIQPIPFEDMRLRLHSPRYYMRENKIICKMPVSQESFEKTKIIQICLYNLESGQPLCRTDGPSITEWEEHNTYYLILDIILLLFVDAKKKGIEKFTNIYNLKNFITEEPVVEKSKTKTRRRKSKSASPRSNSRSRSSSKSSSPSPKSSPRSKA
jgi:hypothetical protein